LDRRVNYQELFAQIHRRPSLFGLDGEYHTFTAFVHGCEAGNDWQLLAGFREWLVTRLGSGDSLAWEGLVLRLAFPDRDHGPGRDELRAEPQLNETAVRTLFGLLDEFLEVRRRHDALAKIFGDYFAARPAPLG
jgi:hypothetical protein